jgi:hypothetical protein
MQVCAITLQNIRLKRGGSLRAKMPPQHCMALTRSQHETLNIAFSTRYSPKVAREPRNQTAALGRHLFMSTHGPASRHVQACFPAAPGTDNADAHETQHQNTITPSTQSASLPTFRSIQSRGVIQQQCVHVQPIKPAHLSMAAAVQLRAE